MSVYPLLSTTRNFFQNMEEVCAGLVVFSVHNPGNITNMWKDSELSLHVLKNLYEKDKNELAFNYQQRLKNAIEKYFPNTGITVRIDTEDINVNAGTYKLIINIEYNGIAVISRRSIYVEEDGVFKLTF